MNNSILISSYEFFLELEMQINLLRETQKKYSQILRLARVLANHFYHVVQTQVCPMY